MTLIMTWFPQDVITWPRCSTLTHLALSLSCEQPCWGQQLLDPGDLLDTQVLQLLKSCLTASPLMRVTSQLSEYPVFLSLSCPAPTSTEQETAPLFTVFTPLYTPLLIINHGNLFHFSLGLLSNSSTKYLSEIINIFHQHLHSDHPIWKTNWVESKHLKLKFYVCTVIVRSLKL